MTENDVNNDGGKNERTQKIKKKEKQQKFSVRVLNL